MGAAVLAAEPAPFGRNQELVLDPSYRNALQIKADGGFALSAGLPTPEMLGDIAALMQPAAPQVFAQLHKLNIYGPGGMFKEHVDTPVGQEHFGSLVVALPATFEGGELVVRHDGRAATLALGGGAAAAHATKATEPTPVASPVAEAGHPETSNAAVAEPDSGTSGSSSGGSGGGGGGTGSGGGDDPKAALGPHVHFVAFFSDCAHEVLPVTSGHRVTLTYNLIATDVAAARKETADEAASRGTRRLLSTVRPLAGGSDPLVAKLRELMAQPTWQPGGATLGYVLEHKYASTFDELTKMRFPHILKGSDRLLCAALCDGLGLHAEFVPLHLSEDENRRQRKPKADGDDEGDLLERVFMGQGFTDDNKQLGWVSVYDMSMRDALEESGFQPATSRDILWLGLSGKGAEAKFPVQTAVSAYGNEPTTAMVYSGVAMLLQVPAGKGAEAKFPVQTAVSAYGNEPTTAMVYSGVAMLLQVPAWGTPQRNAAMAPGEHAHAQAQEQTPGAGPVPAQVEERHDLQ
ncbi:hypothetical protein GPECTOR_78g69 [Gonium pectorale]|uniref:Fe2OG dioxygenase domain-containing protein n=1 Tax=Gonium pectorale TaxID=33097 RepID=A0A150G245_GONPE|nr:hypothetical protein GPECTOR_78g69 [Gonium pectorale]|eukprot:KXZ43881.1 hypothetical protein GPECTOR_78g69 [Gonium pectorale]